MTEKSKIILKKPEEAQIFVWEPTEGFEIEPKFFTVTPKPKKIPKSKRGTKSVE
jgi:hypothetical protein